MQHAQPHSLPSRWMCRANSEFSLLPFVFSLISSERSRVLPSSTDIQQWGFLFWQIKHRWCQGWESIVTWGCELELELDFFLSFLEEFDCFTQHFTVGFLLARLRNFVQSIFKFPAGQSELKLTSFPAKSKMSSEYIANQSWNVTWLSRSVSTAFGHHTQNRSWNLVSPWNASFPRRICFADYSATYVSLDS